MRKMSNRTDSEIIPIPIPILSVVLVSQRKIMIYIIKQPELGAIGLIQLCVETNASIMAEFYVTVMACREAVIRMSLTGSKPPGEHLER